ncbi:MAG: GNAT family N-acetyltransferase [Methanobrevibacter sp.]|nr:GNAT family N-acetyltransferase [Methanobrevibacter sp.]
MTSFDCEHDDLNEFLKEDSIKQKEWMLNSTYLASYNDEIIGFFTLSTDKIKIKDLEDQYKEKFKNKVNYKEFPALKIGRLGVSSSYKSKGIGTYLFKWIISKSINLSKEIGFRFITVDTYVSSYKFYKKNYCKDSFSNDKLKKEFKKFETAQKRNPQAAYKMTVPMFMDLYKFKNHLLQHMDRDP